MFGIFRMYMAAKAAMLEALRECEGLFVEAPRQVLAGAQEAEHRVNTVLGLFYNWEAGLTAEPSTVEEADQRVRTAKAAVAEAEENLRMLRKFQVESPDGLSTRDLFDDGCIGPGPWAELEAAEEAARQATIWAARAKVAQLPVLARQLGEMERQLEDAARELCVGTADEAIVGAVPPDAVANMYVSSHSRVDLVAYLSGALVLRYTRASEMVEWPVVGEIARDRHLVVDRLVASRDVSSLVLPIIDARNKPAAPPPPADPAEERNTPAKPASSTELAALAARFGKK